MVSSSAAAMQTATTEDTEYRLVQKPKRNQVLTSNVAQIVGEGLGELGKTTVGPERGRVWPHSAIFLFDLAAGVGDGSGSRAIGWVSLLPVLVVLDAAALKVGLDEVPGVGHSLVAGIREMLQASAHVLSNLLLKIPFHGKGSNSTSDLCNQNHGKEEAVSVHHALVVFACPAASEEGNGEDDHTQNDDGDGGVRVVIPNKIQDILGFDLGVSTEPDENDACQHEQGVHEEHDVLDEVFEAVHGLSLY